MLWPHWYAVAFAGSLASALVFTPAAKTVALRNGIVDRPRERRVHTKPIPLLGGVAMYLSFLLPVLLALAVGILPRSRGIIGMLIAGGFICAVGVWDDKVEMKPRAKLLGQIISAVILVLFDVKIQFVTNPFGGMFYLGWASIPLTILWIVSFENVVNFLDGLDGLAAGVSAITALAMAFTAHQKGMPGFGYISLALAGSALGFLVFNFNPAKIFMGDAGSMFLGLAIGSISALGAMKKPATLALVLPVLVLGVPILDTAFAIFRRVKSNVPVSEGDRGHVHHRLLAMGMSQRQAVLTLYAVSGILAAVACGIVSVDPKIGIGGAITVFGALVFVGEKSGVLKTDAQRGTGIDGSGGQVGVRERAGRSSARG